MTQNLAHPAGDIGVVAEAVAGNLGRRSFSDWHQRINNDAQGNIIMSSRPLAITNQASDWIRQVLKALAGNGAFGELEVRSPSNTG